MASAPELFSDAAMRNALKKIAALQRTQIPLARRGPLRQDYASHQPHNATALDADAAEQSAMTDTLPSHLVGGKT
jgi:hypothetical protein